MEQKKSLKITGMTCANCARIVEKSLLKIDGVKFAAVNLATNTAFVITEKEVSDDVFQKAVESVGYGISNEPIEAIEEKRLRRIKHNTFTALFVTIPLMVLMLLHMAGKHIPFFKEIELIFSAIVIFYAGRDTIRGATIALLHKHSNMDTLIFFGAVTAWLTNVITYFGVDVHPFGTIGAMIVSLHLVGRYIESSLRDKASKQVKELLALQSKEARIVTDKGEFLVPIDAVKQGHVVFVKPGERIPADGIIIEGFSLIDESMITGESVPVEKGINDEVVGGALNLTGAIKLRVTRVGEDAFLSKMLSLVQEAQGAKVPIQQLADTITNYFVPTIIFLALLSAAFWYFNFDYLNNLTHSIRMVLPWSLHTADRPSFAVFVFLTTVVIACPCALGLATPMALIVGTSLAAKKGLLIRNAEAIQTVKSVGYVLLDKTGTITYGKPRVVVQNIPEEEKPKIKHVTKLSAHPLSKAIAEYLDGYDTHQAVEEFEEIHGRGLKARIGFDEYLIGKPRDSSMYEEYTSKGMSIVEVHKNGDVIGFFALEDTVREDAKEAIRRLRSHGIIPVMVTGDNEKTANHVAKIVGVDEVYASVKPEEKMDIVRKYQSTGKKVIMVGDGINDAAALKAADIGIAIGSGSDLAIDSADIILTKGGISKIADVISISKVTFSAIRTNLLFAFLYNIIAIPLAMMGLLHPAIAEGAMAMSSITVILNSMNIRKKFQKFENFVNTSSCCSYIFGRSKNAKNT